jgi:hypothetical protein
VAIAGDEIDRFLHYTKACDLPIPPPIPKIVEPPAPKVFKKFRNTVEKRSSYVARMRKQGIEVQYYPVEDPDIDTTLEQEKPGSAHKPGSVARAKELIAKFGIHIA